MKAYNALKYVNDYLDSEDFENYVQDSFWRQNFSSDLVFGQIMQNAKDDLLFLEDIDEHMNTIYDLINEAYEIKEKGLS